MTKRLVLKPPTPKPVPPDPDALPPIDPFNMYDVAMASNRVLKIKRALEANGFEVTFIKARNSSHMVLARAAEGDVSWKEISRGKLEARIEKYRLARDRAILKIPADVRQRVGGEWRSAIEHGLAAGALDFDEKGQLRFAVD